MRVEPARLTPWQPTLWAVAALAWIALLVLTLAWELVWAPLRPGGSWLALKAVPLMLAAPGIVRARNSTLQWASLLVLLYVAEGAVRVMEPAPVRGLALVELILAGVFFVAAVGYLNPLKRAARARGAR